MYLGQQKVSCSLLPPLGVGKLCSKFPLLFYCSQLVPIIHMKLAYYSRNLKSNITAEASLVLLVVVTIVLKRQITRPLAMCNVPKCPSALHSYMYTHFVNILLIIFTKLETTYCSQN